MKKLTVAHSKTKSSRANGGISISLTYNLIKKQTSEMTRPNAAVMMIHAPW